jgi:hypothetical protein
MRVRIHELGKHQADWKAFTEEGDGYGLPITVVYTTQDGTLAALKTAAALARGLNARLGLIVTEVVPFRLPIDQPRVPVDFLKQRQNELVSGAGLSGEEIRVQICVCRDTKETLGRLLPTPSLVVLGGRRGFWPSRERRLETFLSRLGHHVIFADAAAHKSAGEAGPATSRIPLTR